MAPSTTVYDNSVMSLTVHFAIEILLEVGRQVTSKTVLSALCLVSKQFNAVFTPLLYQRIWLQDAGWRFVEGISCLTERKHLRHTHQLLIGKDARHA